jgi:hypothetical protein
MSGINKRNNLCALEVHWDFFYYRAMRSLCESVNLNTAAHNIGTLNMVSIQ